MFNFFYFSYWAIHLTKCLRIAIDRPGSGATTLCPISERLETSTSQALSVLSHLQITSPISLLSHSVGIYYAFNLVLRHPELFHPSPRIVTLSPWVPSSISGSSLSLIPTFVINSAMKVAGTCGPDLARLGERLGGMSVGLVSSIGFTSNENVSADSKAARNIRTNVRSQRNYPKATFHPPYTPRNKANSFGLDAFRVHSNHPSTGKTIDRKRLGAEKLLGDFFMKEGTKGTSEDFLMSLGRADGERGGDKGLESLLRETLYVWEKKGGTLKIAVIWGIEDAIVSTFLTFRL